MSVMLGGLGKELVREELMLAVLANGSKILVISNSKHSLTHLLTHS